MGSRTSKHHERSRQLCVIVHGSYPIGEPRVERQAQAARAAGWNVEVIAMRRHNEPKSEVIEGVTVIRLPLEHRRGLSLAGIVIEYVGFTALATMIVALRHLRRRYDVVHICNPPDFLMTAGLLPKALGAGLILDVHDLSSDMFEMRFGPGRISAVVRALLRRIEYAAASLADAVITVHEPYRKELITRGVQASKITIVMNSLDERLLVAYDGPSEESFRIVYHGTITPHYGLDIVIAAFALIASDIPTARLEIHGDGDAVAALRTQAHLAGLDNRVFISGKQLPHRDVLRTIRGANVGVVPNRPTTLNRYALSSKLFEYVALGVPVIAAGLPTLRAHFSDAEVLFFEPGSVESLSHALLEIANNPEATAHRISAAVARYTSEYRWELQAQRYRDVLQAISGAHRMNAP